MGFLPVLFLFIFRQFECSIQLQFELNLMSKIIVMNSKKIKVIIVEDNEKFRASLKDVLEIQFNIEVIGEASNGVEFFQLQNIYNADVVLMDLMMPEKGGYETTFEATSIYRDIKVIAITNQMEYAFLLLILQSGFKGCVFKDNIYDEIMPAIQTVMHGGSYVPEGIKL